MLLPGCRSKGTSSPSVIETLIPVPVYDPEQQLMSDWDLRFLKEAGLQNPIEDIKAMMVKAVKE